MLAHWLEAVAGGDAPRLASLVTEDCVFLAPGAPPIRGRQAVELLYRSLFARYRLKQNFQFEEVLPFGDWAFAWGTDEVAMTPIESGEPVRFAGYGVSILRRESDGVWRFARGINNATRQNS